MTEFLTAVATSPITSGAIGGLIAAFVAFVGGVIDRQQNRDQRRIDRGFDVKTEKYNAYLDSVEKLLTIIYEWERENIDPEAEGANLDAVPVDIRQAERGLRLFAPKVIREKVDAQFEVILSALTQYQPAVKQLETSQEELVELMHSDLGLAQEPGAWLFRPLGRKH